MTEIVRNQFVVCPYSSAMEHVAHFFAEHPNLRAKAPWGASALVQPKGNLLDDASDSSRRHDAYVVSWQPRSHIAPPFDGILTIRSASGGLTLTMSATYEPPGGVTGRLFDLAVGRLVAFVTIDHLLRELRSYMEERARAFAANCPSIDVLNEREKVAK